MTSSWMRRFAIAGLVFAGLVVAVPVFAQTGGVTGKCTGQDGKPLVGYTILVERTEIKWQSKVKTNKKGEYIYIGLAVGNYKFTLLDPSGKHVFDISKHIGIGDPTEVPFDMAKEQALAQKENPEMAKQEAEQEKNAKQFGSLKSTFDQGTALYAQADASLKASRADTDTSAREKDLQAAAKGYADAAASYEQALPLAKEKNVPIVLGKLADSYSQAQKVDTDISLRDAHRQKALDYFTKAIQADPTNAGMHNNLGSLYADMGKIPEAQAEFQKAAETDPQHAGTYYYNMGVIFVNKGNMDEAAVALKKCTDMDATNANAFYWYGMALLGKAQTKPDGTIAPVPGTVEAFQTYLKLEPKGPWADSAKGSLEILQGKVETEYKSQKKKKG